MRKYIFTLLLLAGVVAAHPSTSAPPAATNMNYSVLSGIAVTNKAALEKLQGAAEAGNAEAQFYLGEVYYRVMGYEKEGLNELGEPTGTGTNQAAVFYGKEAFKWYSLAAAQSYANAEERLGEAYGQGAFGNSKALNWPDGIVNPEVVVKKDVQKAFSWYYKAASKGNSDAESALGFAYAQGVGVSPDKTKSDHWYSMSTVKPDTFSIEHNKFENVTRIIYHMPPSALNGNMDFSAIATVHDKSSQLPVFTMYIMSSSDNWRYLDCHSMAWLVEGKPFNFKRTSYTPSVDEVGGGVFEHFTIVATHNELNFLAHADKVEYRICNTDYSLSSKELAGIAKVLSEVDSYVKPQSHTIQNAPDLQFSTKNGNAQQVMVKQIAWGCQ